MRFRMAICLTAVACLSTMVSAGFAQTRSSRGTARDQLRAVKAGLLIDRKTGAVTRVTLRRKTKVDVNVIDALQRFPEIEFLDISSTVPDRGGYAWIGKLSNLKTLKMNGLNVSDEDLLFLPKLRRLERLEVRKNRLSESFVRKFGAQPALKEVDVSAGKIPEDRFRKIEDDLDPLVFLRQWTIEMKEDVFRMRVNTPVADFIFEGAAAPKNYRNKMSVPITGKWSFQRHCRFKKDRYFRDVRVTRRGNYLVKLGPKLDTFEISGDGKKLTFKERSYDITGENQTIFISADEKGVFSKHRTESFALLPSDLDGQRSPRQSSGLNVPILGFHVVDAKAKKRSNKPSDKRKYKGDYKKPTGLGPCWLSDIEFKGHFAMVITEWTDEVMNPRKIGRLGLRFGPKGKPTGRGVTIVYEGVPYGERTNRMISKQPIGVWGGWEWLTLGASRPKRNASTWALEGSFGHGGRGGYHMSLIGCRYNAGVLRIQWEKGASTLEFSNRGRTLRVRELLIVDKLLELIKIPKDILSGRVLFEQEVSPTSEKPLFMVDRDGRVRRVKK